MNNVNLIGRLVRDPETRYAQGDQGTAITSFTLAVDRRVKERVSRQLTISASSHLERPQNLPGNITTRGSGSA